MQQASAGVWHLLSFIFGIGAELHREGSSRPHKAWRNVSVLYALMKIPDRACGGRYRAYSLMRCIDDAAGSILSHPVGLNFACAAGYRWEVVVDRDFRLDFEVQSRDDGFRLLLSSPLIELDLAPFDLIKFDLAHLDGEGLAPRFGKSLSPRDEE